MLILEFLKRIGLAILLSALVGYEREQQDKPAGLRTIMFVCVGAALSVVCAILMGNKFGIDMVSIIRIPAHYLAVAIGAVHKVDGNPWQASTTIIKHLNILGHLSTDLYRL